MTEEEVAVSPDGTSGPPHGSEVSAVAEPEAAPAGLIARLLALHKRYGPWIALITGIGTTLLLRRGLSFVPIAALCLVLSWVLTTVVARWLHPREGEGRLRSLARVTGEGMIAGFYQDTLFFVFPIWLGSSVILSVHAGLLLVLSAMTLLSCFEYHMRAWIMDRPVPRALFSAAILFFTIAPSVPVLLHLPVRYGLALSGALASLSVAVAVMPYALWRTRAGLIRVGASAASTALLVAFLAPYLPPAPMQEISAAVASNVQERQPVSPGDTFEVGTPRVYGWFAIAAPASHSEGVEFHWFKDGEPWGRPFYTRIKGGREQGWRTWSYVSNPPVGAWRVEIHTDGGQLIARQHFKVVPRSSS